MVSKFPLSTRAVSAIAVVAGVLLVLPLLPAPGSADWLRRPLADDAYYYLSTARNAASGAGITSEGLPVNGFQPLYFALCVAVGALAGWSRLGTPLLLTACNVALYLGAGLWLWARIARRLRPGGPLFALFAALWVLSPYGLRAALNGLETAAALVAWVLVLDAVLAEGTLPRGRARAAWTGAALGLAFWVRNDAVVLCVAYGAWTLVRLARAPVSERAGIAGRLLLSAAVVVAIAAPWLGFNLVRFGSPIPQSGHAEAAGGLYDFGRRYQGIEVLASLVRNGSPLPLPLSRVELAGRAALAAPALAVLLLLGTWAFRRARPLERGAIAFLGGAVLLLAAVYGLAFGAPTMLTRWVAPAIVLSVFTFGLLGVELLAASRDPARAAIAGLLLLGVGKLATVRGDGRMPFPTTTYPLHAYLEAHPHEGVVGSLQTGLLSWAHPDVSNLDGKVNVAALAALEQGTFPRWVADGRVTLIVDQSLFGLERSPELVRAFEPVPAEPGLIVLRRRAKASSGAAISHVDP